MSYEARFRLLLSNGYLPKELPPTFSSTDFGQQAVAILKEWERHRLFSKQNTRTKVAGKRKRDSYNYNFDASEAELLSTPKKGYERRTLHIVHPLPQLLLSKELAENWQAVQKWLSRQSFSLDQIRISSEYSRAIKSINFDIHNAKKSFIEATSDWITKTDITRFYPTIYTHSIPWAAYGKEKVKRERAKFDGSLADRLDLLVRKCNRDQTIGIPIGPETSRIIAEIISSHIDADFRREIPASEVGPKLIDRLQDDWFVGTSSFEAAEKILSKISLIYRNYGLEINGSKTAIGRMIESADSQWKSEIGAFLSHAGGALSGAKLKELLSLCLRMQATYPTESVTAYVLPVLESRRFAPGDVEALESFLLKCAVNSPITLPSISRILINLQHNTKKLSVKRISDRFTRLAEINIEKGNLFEVIWLIYTIRGLRGRLQSKIICEMIETIPSSAFP